MISYLKHLSAWLFYLLGLSFFGAYFLLRNDMGGAWPGWWMRVADLPLLLFAILFGGISLYQSVTRNGSSVAKALVIGIPLVSAFVAMTILNFWGILHGMPDA